MVGHEYHDCDGRPMVSFVDIDDQCIPLIWMVKSVIATALDDLNGPGALSPWMAKGYFH